VSNYERRCRVLLRAFPPTYRSERSEEMLGVLLDTNAPDRRWPSLGTTVDLLTAGLRVRSRLGTQGRASVAVVEGLRLAALVGLCLQAAFSVAMVGHYIRDGMLFYLPHNAWSTAAHGALAGIWLLAFGVLVAGRARLALIPAIIGSAGSVILLATNFHGRLGAHAPLEVLLAVQMTLLGLVPTLALVVASARRPSTATRRSPMWSVALVALTAAFSVLGTGVRVGPGGGRQLTFASSGGLVTFLSMMCMGALVVMLLAGPFDPRLGVAMIAVSMPIIVYQVGMLVSVRARPAWSVAFAVLALVSAATVTVSSGVSFRRLGA